ncbi:unnamed protein product [Leptidea sinapis]|uniref:SH3 domain-containing protein n=1 Tax=Leptidea sinapis TaxID=189913 RepID=A0A5E4PVU9_9NEOP|nr:unnamed protein product [Leptidea sinapis]
MTVWRKLENQECYAIAVYNFSSTPPHLQLEVGELVHIERECRDWYWGRSLRKEACGAFPKNYVVIRQCHVERCGETVVASAGGSGVVHDIALTLREWLQHWKLLYTKNDERFKFMEVSMRALLELRGQAASGALPQDLLRRMPTVRSYTVVVHIKNFVCRMSDTAELSLALHDSSGTKLTESVLLKWSPQLAMELFTAPSLVFTDLGSDIKKEKIFLVCHIVRIGSMEAHNDDHRCEKDNMDSLLKKVISNRDLKEQKQTQGLWVYLQMVEGDLKQIRQENPHIVVGNTAFARKMGFPEVILPGDARNDLYVTICSGSFSRGGKSTDRNIELRARIDYKRSQTSEIETEASAACLGLPSRRDELPAGSERGLTRAPLSLVHRDTLTVATKLCSTKLTQREEILGVLKWSTHHAEGTLRDALSSLLRVPNDELVKFLQDILDALFSILTQVEEDCAEYSEKSYAVLVLDCLLLVISLVSDHKYQHFQPLISIMVWTIRSAENGEVASKRLLQCMKCLESLVRVLVRSRQLRAALATGQSAGGVGMVDAVRRPRTDLPGFRTQVELCVETLGEVVSLLARDDVGPVDTDRGVLARALLPTVLKIAVAMIKDRGRDENIANDDPLIRKLICVLLDMVRQMSEEQYLTVMKSVDAEGSGKTDSLVGDALALMTSLLQRPVVRPHWADMLHVQHYVMLHALRLLARTLRENLLTIDESDTDAISTLHQTLQDWFETVGLVAASPPLQLENFPASRRQRAMMLYGDIRRSAASLLSEMWHGLEEHKRYFIPQLVGPFLEVSFLCDDEVRNTIIPLFFDMMLTEYRYTQETYEVARLLEHGHQWELAVEVVKELVSVQQLQYSALAQLHDLLAALYRASLKETRLPTSYFRVRYLGKGFPPHLLNAKGFVYRGNECDMLHNFKERMLDEWPEAEVLLKLDEPGEDITESDGQYVLNGSSDDLSAVNEFATRWLERTEIEISDTLPGILRWFPVISSRTYWVCPLEVAIETMTNSNRQLKRLIMDSKSPPVPLHPLTMRLQGILDSPVQGGLVNYERAFLSTTYELVTERPLRAEVERRLSQRASFITTSEPASNRDSLGTTDSNQDDEEPPPLPLKQSHRSLDLDSENNNLEANALPTRYNYDQVISPRNSYLYQSRRRNTCDLPPTTEKAPTPPPKKRNQPNA